MDANQIIDSLARDGFLSQRYELMIPNVFIQPDSEADMFCVRKSGLCDEIEVKISRSDFLADAKKVVRYRDREPAEQGLFSWDDKEAPWCKPKHQALADGDMCVNYFYFAVPQGLVEPDELPEFAGLLEIREGRNIRFAKEAERLHRNKMPFEDRYQIARKSNYRYWDMRLGKFRPDTAASTPLIDQEAL